MRPWRYVKSAEPRRDARRPAPVQSPTGDESVHGLTDDGPAVGPRSGFKAIGYRIFIWRRYRVKHV